MLLLYLHKRKLSTPPVVKGDYWLGGLIPAYTRLWRFVTKYSSH